MKNKNIISGFSGGRYIDLIIGIPTILVAFAITAGIYSLKAYLALQEYYLRSTHYTIFVPENASFHYNRYLNLVFAYIAISLVIGVVIGYLVSKALTSKKA